MIDAHKLKSESDWDGSDGASRKKLLTAIQNYFPADQMMPDNRLNILIDQALKYQTDKCILHTGNNENSIICSNNNFNSDGLISLLKNHHCPKTSFPTMTKKGMYSLYV